MQNFSCKIRAMKKNAFHTVLLPVPLPQACRSPVAPLNNYSRNTNLKQPAEHLKLTNQHNCGLSFVGPLYNTSVCMQAAECFITMLCTCNAHKLTHKSCAASSTTRKPR